MTVGGVYVQRSAICSPWNPRSMSTRVILVTLVKVGRAGTRYGEARYVSGSFVAPSHSPARH